MNVFASLTTRSFQLRSLQRERRLHKRAVAYWEVARGRAPVPLLANFEFVRDHEFASRGFLVNAQHDYPSFCHIGEILMDEAELGPSTIALEAVPAETLLGKFGGRYSLAISARAPVATEHVFDTSAGYRISCRGVLLPLSASGDSIDHVYGVVSWKSNLIAHPEGPAEAIAVFQ